MLGGSWAAWTSRRTCEGWRCSWMSSSPPPPETQGNNPYKLPTQYRTYDIHSQKIIFFSICMNRLFIIHLQYSITRWNWFSLFNSDLFHENYFTKLRTYEKTWRLFCCRKQEIEKILISFSSQEHVFFKMILEHDLFFNSWPSSVRYVSYLLWDLSTLETASKHVLSKLQILT